MSEQGSQQRTDTTVKPNEVAAHRAARSVRALVGETRRLETSLNAHARATTNACLSTLDAALADDAESRATADLVHRSQARADALVEATARLERALA